ncbi:glycine betaine ABC transporter substrate-binding protein [Glutamicibacter creatinolyticus]|uniref:ABC transporter substrate-binding protein n=1 Tax=Glutamicibacter creatinolyticus TaxID=162496 RepID=UPI0037C0527F
MRKMIRTGIIGLAAMFALAGCGSGDPLDSGESSASGKGEPIVIGSQDYYSSEIISEVYAQALEAEGYSVDRQFRIGQREVYVPELESGDIDLFPEYTGPLLQYWEPDTEARLSDDVYESLKKAAPEGLRVLEQSPATDQDSYTVTKEFAERWGVETIDDLAKVTEPMTMGANSEAEERPNGPKGLKETYGVDVGFTPIEDSGGPLTVKALNDGSIQLAIIYTADPTIAQNKLVSIKDTKGLFLASHVVPLASDNVDQGAEDVINKISAAMQPEDLLNMNRRSVADQLPASEIAREWLRKADLG